MARRFASFRDFYPYYLTEHRDQRCRRLHFAGTSLVIIAVLGALVTWNFLWLAAAPVAGYGFAWLGHVLFEHNRPATFRHPFYSLLGDLVMFRDMLIGRIAR